jgi:hypothetical protein
MFGRKRDKYVEMDVFSDEEDMEADADALEREEIFRLVCDLSACHLRVVLTVCVPPALVLRRERTCRLSRKSDDTRKRNAGARRRRSVSPASELSLRLAMEVALDFLDIQRLQFGKDLLHRWNQDARTHKFDFTILSLGLRSSSTFQISLLSHCFACYVLPFL